MRHANAKIRFSMREKRDLLKAWIAISATFTVFFLTGGYIDSVTTNGLLWLFGVSAATAGIGFLVHELCHKFAAHRFRVQSEFRSHDSMLFFSFILAFLGVLIAAPGAVYMAERVNKRESGIISAAGPVSNMVLALLFFPLATWSFGLLAVVGKFGLFINAFLGAFNMIPFLGFDGAKIIKWSKPIYFSTLGIGIALVLLAYSVF